MAEIDLANAKHADSVVEGLTLIVFVPHAHTFTVEFTAQEKR